ncbi:helix-turn-helix transcriptional regulator [Thalassotalea marina]|uniref:HTH cro/C1-type domain-containing protein n=1 Tax=Thalassotalea marina TaxID=1673741 RepID=A0A919BK97_9GAMM|nr:helix-turn-helix domain-containing protein [Thalassotalea marina]GHF96255.1 hypothetical protein GCM10017161_25760 [Thalassotalea marina]
MDMKLNAEKIIKERQSKAWSQQHLADVSGLSLRTIQRVENNGTGSLETIKSLAACFEIKVDSLYQEQPSTLNKSANTQTTIVRKGNIQVLSFTTMLLVLACYILLKTPNSYASNIKIKAQEVKIHKKGDVAEFYNDVSIEVGRGVTFEIDSYEEVEMTDKSMFVIKLPDSEIIVHQIKIEVSETGLVIHTDYAKKFSH